MGIGLFERDKEDSNEVKVKHYHRNIKAVKTFALNSITWLLLRSS